MAQPGNPTGFRNKVYSADASVTLSDITGFGRLVADTAGIRLTLPDPIQYLGGQAWEAVVDNESTGPILVKGDFVGDRTGLFVPAGKRMRIQCHLDTTLGYTWMFDGETEGYDAAGTYQPTLAWATADPTTIVKNAYYWITDDRKLMFIGGEITVADGNAATALTISLPSGIIPANIGVEVPITAIQTIDGTPTSAIGYVDCSSGTAATRCLVKFYGFSTWTDNKACKMQYFGVVPLTALTSVSLTETWSTGTPTSITEAVVYEVIGGICVMFGQWSSADSTGATDLTFPLPLASQDIDCYMPFQAIQTTVNGSDVTTVGNPLGTIDLANATEANRLASFHNFTTATDNKAVKVSFCCAYPVANGSSWIEYDADPTYTQDGTILTDPVGTVVEEAFWSAKDGVVAFCAYQSATDGNDCTAVVQALPVKPAGLVKDLPLVSYQEQHTDTKKTPLAVIDVSEENIACLALHKLDNAEATKLYVGGLYPAA